MSAVTVTITGRDLANLIPQAAREGLVAAAEVLQSEIGAIFQKNRGGAPSQPGEPPAVQTNTLRQSWEIDRESPAVYSEVPYAATLETGAVIRPKNAGALVIPISVEARKLLAQAGGRPALAIIRLRLQNPKRFRQIPTDNGKLIGLGQSRRNQRWFTPYFVVTNKATIAARPYVDRSINNATRNGTMVDAFADAAMRRLEAGQ